MSKGFDGTSALRAPKSPQPSGSSDRGAAAKHCDDYIDDPAQPEALRRFLHYKRLPAVCQHYWPGCEKHIEPELHQYIWRDPVPVLFADHEGCRVRVNMASRFGDVGISTALNSDRGYSKRVAVADLSNFADKP